ncbi:hypothetical protein [Myxococcus sp. AM010]|uniref:hypothetical protein n=2 Tax=unclassified Myxococcus TaxID=2648731 RepID=UPI00159561E4|nr:hypothetical protein [Myxococcus sp. AM010]NVJ19253.1 hypothetical protein [Myxococcus sp. AM010]
MKIPVMLAALGLAAGLSLGCGGVEGEVGDQDNLASREDALPWCGNSSYSYSYFSDATYSVRVGSEFCSCYGPVLRRGSQTAFMQVDWEDICPER